MRPATPLDYAEAHLAGPWQDEDRDRWFECRKCGAQIHVDHELEPTAFCNGCAFHVLDELAEAVVQLTARLRIAEQTRDAAQAASNRDVNDRRDAMVALRAVLASAAPNKRDHPAMHSAWAVAERFLNRGY